MTQNVSNSIVFKVSKKKRKSSQESKIKTQYNDEKTETLRVPLGLEAALERSLLYMHVEDRCFGRIFKLPCFKNVTS